MFRIRARKQPHHLWREKSEHGFETAEAVIVIPAILAIVFGIIQGSLYLHATNVAGYAAHQAAVAAAAYDGSSGAGNSAGYQAASSSSGMLSNVSVTTSRGAQTSSATVTADIPTLVPWATFTVTKTVQMPTERWNE